MTGSSNWTDIPNGDIDQDSPATETLFTAIRDNINAAQWNYYDDGDGVIYDHSVDGTVANIVSPDFEDGYEYAFIFAGVQVGVASLNDVNIEAFFDNDASYSSPVEFINEINSNSDSFRQIRFPRAGLGLLISNNSVIAKASDLSSKIDKVRLSAPAGQNFTAGKIIMLRRHNNL